jgi:hypothetical protein
MNYSTLEGDQKVLLVERLSIAYNARKMYVDDFLKKHDPEVEEITLQLKKEKVGELLTYLQLRK